MAVSNATGRNALQSMGFPGGRRHDGGSLFTAATCIKADLDLACASAIGP
jgi:hypothetical protein